jgi:hypothetical protein
MGKVIVGIAALLLIFGIYLTTPAFASFSVWAMMNIIMAIDMLILNNKRKKQVAEQSTKKCPKCAELIKKEATVCRFCGAAVNA